MLQVVRRANDGVHEREILHPQLHREMKRTSGFSRRADANVPMRLTLSPGDRSDICRTAMSIITIMSVR